MSIVDLCHVLNGSILAHDHCYVAFRRDVLQDVLRILCPNLTTTRSLELAIKLLNSLRLSLARKLLTCSCC